MYPKFANFSSRSGTARNIAIKVELMDGQEHALPLVFGKAYCPNMSDHAYSHVCYHNRLAAFTLFRNFSF